MPVFVVCPSCAIVETCWTSETSYFCASLFYLNMGGRGKIFLLSFRLNEFKPDPVEMLLMRLQVHLAPLNVALFSL